MTHFFFLGQLIMADHMCTHRKNKQTFKEQSYRAQVSIPIVGKNACWKQELCLAFLPCPSLNHMASFGRVHIAFCFLGANQI